MNQYHLIIDDLIGRWGYSKQWVRRVLDSHRGKHVDVRISSLGGDLDHGLDIRQQFKEHGDVTVYLTGFVASAATIIAMGAKRICMSKYAMFLVHKCSNFIDAWGNYNADEMQQLIEQLEANKQENDRIDVVIAQLYAEKCGKSVNEILNVLKEGRWLTAQQALDYGFVDEITEEDEKGNGKQNLTTELRDKFNAFGLTLEGLEEANPNDSERSMLRQILDHITALFTGSKSNDSADEPESVSTQITTTEMNSTNFSALMAVLAVTALSANADGSVTLTAEQMQTLNDHLASLNSQLTERDNTIADRDNTIKGLNSQVEALKQLPGDDTKGNLDDTSKGELSENEMYNLAKSFIE